MDKLSERESDVGWRPGGRGRDKEGEWEQEGKRGCGEVQRGGKGMRETEEEEERR